MGRKRTGGGAWKLRRENEQQVWYVRFSAGGKKHERSTGTRDEAAANAEAARIVAAAHAGALATARQAPRAGAGKALGPLVVDWLDWLAATHARTTIKTWGGYATSHFVPYFGTVDKLTDDGCKAYQRHRLTQVEGVTVRKEQSALRSLIEYLVEARALARPVEVPKLPKRATGTTYARRTRRTAPSVTPAQTLALIRKLPEWSASRKVDRFPIRARFIVGYETGLRSSTLDRLTVPKNYRAGSSVLRLDKESVKERWARDVPLSRRARRVLDYLLRCYGPGFEGPLFGWHNYREHIAAAAREALPPEIAERFAGTHLRSAMLTHKLGAGASIPGVQFLVGHTLMSTTALYIKPDFEAALEALDTRRR